TIHAESRLLKGRKERLLVRLASQCRHGARGGRAVLLCACAIAALVAQPALAVPAAAGSDDVASIGAAGEAGTLAARIALRRPNMATFAATPSGATLTPSSGVFDVRVDAPAVTGNSARGNRAGGAPAELTSRAEILSNMARPSAASIEQMLVTNKAPMAADQVQMENGAIVLTSSGASAMASKSGTIVAAAKRTPPPIPPNNGNGNGNGGNGNGTGNPGGNGNGNPGGNGNGNPGGNGNGNGSPGG